MIDNPDTQCYCYCMMSDFANMKRNEEKNCVIVELHVCMYFIEKICTRLTYFEHSKGKEWIFFSLVHRQFQMKSRRLLKSAVAMLSK